MDNINVDTVKLKESGIDILNLAKELNEQIETFFSRISNMSTNTREWVGNNANEFIRISNIEKIQYKKLIQSLNSYGNFLINAAYNYEECMKNMR